MPICRTCRGEYDQAEALCPNCGKALGRRDELCRHCGTDTAEKRLCPRCKSDVSVWERENITLLEFVFLQGGVLGLLPALGAVGMWLLFWIPREKSLYYYPVLTAAAVGISLLLFCVLYIKRLFWWERWWASQVYRAAPVSVVASLTVSGLLGMFCSALWAFLYAAWGKPEGLLAKAFFALVYVLSYVCLTVALTLLFIHRYISRLERHAPQPIFVDTRRLLTVVVDTVTRSVNLAFDFNAQKTSSPTAQPLSSSTPTPHYETLAIMRFPENGGILITFRECKPVQYPDEQGQMREKWMEMLWQVQADRWGRVQSVKPTTLESYRQGNRVFRDYGRYS